MMFSKPGISSLRQALAQGAALFFFCQAVLLIYIQFPAKVNFDEFHYVPAAREFLEGKAARNWEHPPLGKILIAAGMKLAGDRPMGWRLASVTAGSTVVATYFTALTLFSSGSAAAMALIIVLSNGFLYVQSRIALLDASMVAFLSWGIFFLIKALQESEVSSRTLRWMSAAGVCMGLAIGCKWPALPAVPLSIFF